MSKTTFLILEESHNKIIKKGVAIRNRLKTTAVVYGVVVEGKEERLLPGLLGIGIRMGGGLDF